MTQQEKYAFHLPYEPKCLVQGEEEMATIIGMSPYLIEYIHQGRQLSEETSFEYCKPMLRSWSQLTQECTQKDYNDGKPFVPSYELSKRFKNAEDYIFVLINIINGKEDMSLEKFLKWCPINIAQQLLKLHFPVGFEAGEYIEVTNDNNPYK